MTTPFQPTLPIESVFSDAEIQFMEESPPGLFAENQNSNIGLFRKIFAERVTEIAQQQDTIYNERFASTSLAYLDEWETDLALPVAPTSLSVAQRRQDVTARRQRGLFTRARRQALIEKYIAATTGTPIMFTPAGVAMVSAGVPLSSEAASSYATLYRVYEDHHTFSYTVRIKNTVTPSAGLLRELTRITPAHLTFTYDNSLSNILSYPLEIKDSAPIIYMRLASLADSSGWPVPTPTAVGGVTPGLGGALPSNTGDTSTSFDGVDDYIQVPDFGSTLPFTAMAREVFSFEAWVKPLALPASGTYKLALGKNSAYLGMVNNGIDPAGMFVFNPGGGTYVASPSSVAVVNGLYHLVGTIDQTTAHLYVNGVQVASGIRTGGSLGGPFTIGAAAGTFWNGYVDEAALYDRPLTPTEILRHYNTGMNIP